MDDLNKLCILMVEAGKADEALHGAIAQWLALNRSEVASAALAVERLHNAGPWQALIVERLEDLGARLTARFPRPDDLLADL
jgi:hypothetical protein